MPNREIQSPRKNALFTRHAEEEIANQFVKSVSKAGLKPDEVIGTLRLHQSNPTGVCTACFQGINNPNVAPGILKQLSQKYPSLIIYVSSEGIEINNRMNFIIKNGKLVE